MASEMNRKEVLDLLARKKIGVDEAAELLQAIAWDDLTEVESEPEVKIRSVEKPRSEEAPDDLASNEKISDSVIEDEPRWLRIRVKHSDSERNKVSVNIPVGMVRFGLNMARTFAPQSQYAHFDEVQKALSDMRRGILVDVEDDDSNERVQICLE